MERKQSSLNGLRDLAKLNPSDDAADHAIERARDALAAINAAPSPDVGEGETPQATRRGEVRGRPMLSRAWALAAIAAALAVIFLLAEWLPFRSGASFGFDEVQKTLAGTKSLQYREIQTIRLKDAERSEIVYVSHVSSLNGLLRRREFLPAEQPVNTGEHEHRIAIYDGKQTRQMNLPAITLFPDRRAYKKLVSVGSWDRAANAYPGATVISEPEPDSTYEWLRQAPDVSAKRLPAKTIDGKAVVGFELEQTAPIKRNGKPDTVTTKTIYWVDPSTKLPLRVEETFHATQSDEADIDSVYDKLVFDVPIDRSLFAIDPPAGWNDLAALAHKEPEPQSTIPGKTEFVFADVQEVVAKTKSVQYTETETHEHGPDVKDALESVQRVKVLGTLRKRVEATAFDLGKLFPDLDVVPASREGAPKTLPESFGEEIAKLKGVKIVAGELQNKASPTGEIVDVDDRAHGGKGILLFGCSPQDWRIQHARIISGRKISADDSNKVMIGYRLASFLHKGIGDTISFANQPFEIVGTFESNLPIEGGSVIIPLADLQKLDGLDREVEGFEVSVIDPSDKAAVASLCQQIEALRSNVRAYSHSDWSGPTIAITDSKACKMLFLYPENKAFLSQNCVVTIGDENVWRESQGTLNFYDLIREVPKDAKRFDERVIDGKKLDGFSVEKNLDQEQDTDRWKRVYWVEPDTKLPVRIETSYDSEDPTRYWTKWVLSDIVFDADLDPKLFSTDPPAGWTDLNAKK